MEISLDQATDESPVLFKAKRILCFQAASESFIEVFVTA